MYGLSPGFPVPVNAEFKSMGGVVECGHDVDTKTSPHHAAFEKAQAELQQEFDIREERRRELEFLEKGGNPLDFKFLHGAAVSVQSTSLTDQHADLYVTSEAKGSFTLAASPHGDSVESSGRPGGSIGREANIGDNLLLLDGENTKLHGERSAKHRGKRGSVALLEQVSHVDGCNNVKGTDDSVIFRLGAKSQAYARRNRTRTSRDSANLTLTDLASRHANRASITSSSIPGSSDVKESLTRLAVQDHAVASNSNSMAGNPDVDFKERTLVADDRVGKSLAMVHKSNVKTESTDMTIDALPEGGKNVNTTETSPGIDPFNQPSSIAEKAPKGAFNDGSLPAGQVSTPLESNESKEINDAGNDNESGVPDKTMTNFDENDPSYEKSVEGRSKRNCTADATSKFFLTNSTCNINSIDGDQSFMPSDGMPCGEFIDQSTFKESMSDKPFKDNDLFKSDVVNDTNDASKSIQQDLSNSAVQMKDETCDSKIRMLSEVVPVTNSEPMKLNEEIIYETDVKSNNSLSDSSCIGKDGASLLTSPASDSPKTILVKLSTASETIDLQISTADQKKAHEEAILEEARLIEARLKRAGELSTSNTHFEKQRKCHWDFVLEEMAWMANDFMQERLWKTAAASQVSRLIASCGRAKFEQANILGMRKNATNSLANSVIHFWHEAEVICMNDKASNAMHHECKSDRLGLLNAKKTEVEAGQHPRTVLDYAVRFLKHNDSAGCHSVLGELPATPSCQNGSRILEIPYEDQLSEVWGSLYYTVPARAMRAYRESMESQWMYYKKLGNSMHQDDCETSICNSVSGGPGENAYEEDEGETGTYLFAENFETGLPSKHSHKKRKDIIQKSNATRVSEGGYFSYEPEGKLGNQPFVLNGKRNSSTFNVGSFPTRRVRTSSRQRIVTPYPPGSTAPLQMTSKTDASSEDTSSFLGDQSSLHRGSVPRKNPGFETTVDFERKFPFDNNEISSKSKKKKKKPRHLGYKNSLNLDDRSLLVTPGRGSMQGSFYEQRLQADTMIHQEQKEHVKKRLESQNYDSNGGTVIYGQHAAKKPKLLKQLSEASAEALVPVSGSLPSPVASQMSNMSNSNKLIKIIANRDRARKNKALKMAAGQSGSGSPWSNFEDQALVVLVHDMGPNWELVSDAINNTLKFKCIFRKPKECKERHKFLMDKSAGDGADSAEDSGSSQPYPSSLPGIPKGSARQLFQRLQGPMEEDILKTHFEKIILLGQKLSSCIRQIDNQDSKQITAAHNSHVVALSQVCPNNLNRGILTPLDFCESISSSPEAFSLAYQGPHAGGLAVPSHQGSMPPSPILPPSSSTMLQGPTGMVLSSTLPSASTSSNPSPRDSQRYTVPRPSAVPVDDPQRLQQYNQILSGRTLQQSNTTLPGALPLGVDRGVRMLPVASGMGMMPGGNRGMPMSRPAFQGIGSPSMLNMVSSGNMMSSGHGMQNTVNVHPNAVSSQGNSIMRPRDPLQVLRPGQNPEEHRQMMMQELQMQASQPNGQSAPPFNGISAAFSNATIPTAIQTFQVQQHQQSHQMLQPSHMLGNPHHHQIQGANLSGTQQQAYAMRAAKERQLHQRMMPQPQHHISGSNTVSSAQSNSQIQPQSQSCSSVTPVSSLQGQHKQPNAARNLPPGMSSQITKPKQRPQVQINQSRQQQQRQQPQQQAKLMKGPGRGGMLIHHNLSADASQVSGFSTASKIQVSDKHMVQQSQGFYPGNSGLNSTLHQPGNQTNIYPHSLPQSTKQMSPVSDSCNQGSAQSSPNMLTQQAPSVALPKQHQQPQPRYFNQSQQGTQRIVLQHNRHMNSDGKLQSSTDQSPYPKGATSASVAPCNDSGPSATLGSSATLWNPEASFDTNAPTPTAHVSSAQESVLGSEPLLPSSGQGLLPHQLPGGVTLHGHNIGGQRQQQQQQQQQQQKQPPSPPPQQQKQQPQHQKEPLHSRQSDLGAG